MDIILLKLLVQTMDALTTGVEGVVKVALVITMESVIHGKMQISVQEIVDVIIIIFVSLHEEKLKLIVKMIVDVIQMVYVKH